MKWFGKRRPSEPEAPAALHASELHGMAAEDLADYEQELELTDKREGKGSRRKAWWITIIIMGVVVGGTIILILKYTSAPVTVDLSAAAPSIRPTPTPQNGRGLLSGIYVALEYPGEFDQVSRITSDPTALEQYSIGSKASYRRLIAVNVRKLESGNLDDDASYKRRLLYPKEYTETKQAVTGAKVSIMTKVDGHEQTLFWAQGGKLLTVSATSTESGDNVPAFLATVRESVTWRQ